MTSEKTRPPRHLNIFPSSVFMTANMRILARLAGLDPVILAGPSAGQSRCRTAAARNSPYQALLAASLFPIHHLQHELDASGAAAALRDPSSIRLRA